MVSLPLRHERVAELEQGPTLPGGPRTRDAVGVGTSTLRLYHHEPEPASRQW